MQSLSTFILFLLPQGVTLLNLAFYVPSKCASVSVTLTGICDAFSIVLILSFCSTGLIKKLSWTFFVSSTRLQAQSVISRYVLSSFSTVDAVAYSLPDLCLYLFKILRDFTGGPAAVALNLSGLRLGDGASFLSVFFSPLFCPSFQL